MTHVKLIIFGFLLLILTSFSPNTLPQPFIDLLNRANMVFENPKGFEETHIIENRQMNYEYAVKHPNKKFEIRYAVRPLDNLIKEYQTNQKKQGSVNVDPNKFYATALQATVLNISGGQLSKINVFGKEAVKQEFNADWGATTLVPVGKEFGQNYKYCMVVTIHKDSFGDAYTFYLSDSKEGFDKFLQVAFHCLKFK